MTEPGGNEQQQQEQQRTPVEIRYLELRSALLDTRGLDDIPEPDPIIADVLFRDSLAWIQGKPGNAKSFVALDMAGCIATGESWQGFKTTPGPVIYIAAEGVAGMRWRVRAWEEAMGREMTGVKWLPVPVQASLPTDWQAFTQLAADLVPALIVVDTQARVTVGMEENAAKDMGEFVDQLETLRRATGACVLAVHHQGRTGEHMRGSTALEGAATTVVQVAKDEGDVTVKCAKQKDGEQFDDIALQLLAKQDSAVLMRVDDFGTTRAKRTATMKMARAWWDTFEDELVSASKLVTTEIATERTFYRNVKDLIRDGFAVKDTAGQHTKYRLLRCPTEGEL